MVVKDVSHDGPCASFVVADELAHLQHVLDDRHEEQFAVQRCSMKKRLSHEHAAQQARTVNQRPTRRCAAGRERVETAGALSVQWVVSRA